MGVPLVYEVHHLDIIFQLSFRLHISATFCFVSKSCIPRSLSLLPSSFCFPPAPRFIIGIQTSVLAFLVGISVGEGEKGGGRRREGERRIKLRLVHRSLGNSWLHIYHLDAVKRKQTKWLRR